MSYNTEKKEFGKYLGNIRAIQGISVDDLAEGICDGSQIIRIENGERASSILLRDRLIERLGATGDEYEKVAQVDEFKKWKQRRAIIVDLEKGDYADAKGKVEAYYKQHMEENALEEQFCLDMETMIAKMSGAGNVSELALKALSKSINLDALGLVMTKKLSPREINLIIEYSMSLDQELRVRQLERLLNYAETKGIMDRNRVLFYPKLVYTYVGQSIENHKEDSRWLARAMELVDRAENLLIETHRLFFILELLEVKKTIWKCVHELSTEKGASLRIELLDGEAKDEEKYCLWTEMGQVYGVDMATKNWCYLYREEGVKCIGDIIRKRRKTLGMSKDELCIDICDPRTLDRIEGLKNGVKAKRMRMLLERLGLSGEYQWSCISVTDSETKQMEENIIKYSNSREYNKALAELAMLKYKKKNPAPYDEQFILMNKSVLQYRKQEITPEDCYESLQEAFKYTLPRYDVSGEFYLTRIEHNCLYNMAIICKGHVSEEIVNFVIKNIEAGFNVPEEKDTRIMELYLLAVIDIMIATGDWKRAEEYNLQLIRLELSSKRSPLVFQALNENIRIFKLKKEAGITDTDEEEIRNERLTVAMRPYRLNKQTNKQTNKQISPD